MQKVLLIFTLLLATHTVKSQIINKDNLYGKWRITGDFKEGRQLLTALNDTITNPRKYYRYLNEDGTFYSDVVAIGNGYSDHIQQGMWFYNQAHNSIVFNMLKKTYKKRLSKHTIFGSKKEAFRKAFERPIVELTEKRLVLHDMWHNSYGVYVK
ncbi:MAG: hypothetical protein HKN52_00640 [Eudoraea sp.]|nr:hypothetical protein [Eudoraea sp.]